MTKIDPKIAARMRVARFRANHRRIDYAPSPDVLELIEQAQATNPDLNIQGVIDLLVEQGATCVTGNVVNDAALR